MLTRSALAALYGPTFYLIPGGPILPSSDTFNWIQQGQQLAILLSPAEWEQAAARQLLAQVIKAIGADITTAAIGFTTPPYPTPAQLTPYPLVLCFGPTAIVAAKLIVLPPLELMLSDPAHKRNAWELLKPHKGSY